MKIASITPLYKQDIFIKPHFDMITKLDRNIVLLSDKGWPPYLEEHGDPEYNNTEKILREIYPTVEIYKTDILLEDGRFDLPRLYNQGLDILNNDCDYVMRLDCDMILNNKDFAKLTDFVRYRTHDSYMLDFKRNTINYYMDFDHGLADAKEYDTIIIKGSNRFTQYLNTNGSDPYTISWPDFMIHHFRGWNKPKSMTKDWMNTEYAKTAFATCSDYGDWYKCPQEIRDMFDLQVASQWLDRFI